jgi:hypothetical protein
MSFPSINALDFLSWRQIRIEILRDGVEKLCEEVITGKRSANQKIERLMPSQQGVAGSCDSTSR